MGWGLRIVTANLRNGKADPDAFAELIASLTPDAVAVQELGPRQAAALARVLFFGRLVPARDHTGMGIALRRPGGVRTLTLPCRNAFIAELGPEPPSDGAEPVELINVHLSAPHIQPFWRTLGRRRGQVRGLTAYLDREPRGFRILVGDFNSTPLWPAYRRLAARLADGALAAARQRPAGARATWGPGSGAPRLLRIDHILVGGVTLEEVRTASIPGSDHDALVADVTVPDEHRAAP